MKLTQDELMLLCDAERFRVQQSTGVKISELFSQLKLSLTPLVHRDAAWLPQGSLTSGKVSRGDRHHGFPWMALDFPAVFSPASIFTYRTVVIWGHHFSFHLITTGEWKARFGPLVLQHAAAMEMAGLRKSLASTPWDWTQDILGGVKDAGPGDAEFMKLSLRLPLERYAEMPELGVALYECMADVLRPSPRD